jgi:murein L,D-transpeptidase YcbB/YkuD
MRGLRYDRILTGTALALVFAMPTGAYAAPVTSAAIEAAVPMPDPAALPPPTSADIITQPVITQPAITQPAITPPAPATTGSTPAVTPAEPQNAVPQSASAPATETVVPDPLASLDPADRPIAEKMRDLLAAKVDKIFANKKERSAVETFYQNRNLAPLWLEKGVETPRAKAAIERLKAADSDGLELADYKIPDFAAAQGPDSLAEAELKLTATILTYARHVQAGRFPFLAISRNNIELPQQPPDTTEVLTKLADAKDAGKTLDEFGPPQQGYKALKAKLAEMRGKNAQAGGQIADGPVLKPNKVPIEDPRVPQLREKLGLKDDPADLRYDAALVEAVKKFQRNNELKITGLLDTPTIRELNGPPRDRQIDSIIVNMERWRWIPRDLGKAYVMVNLPDYTLKVVHNGATAWTTRIVIGKPAMQTPLLSETMKYITVNPTWNVPPSIVQNEYLPALQQDPTALDRIGLKVIRNPDGSIHIYQPPGDGNALGRIRFNFPNRFLVYQHDTPDKQLFKDERRAYSHGCMRVQDPVRYAEVLLGIVRPNDNYTQDRIRRMFGHEEQDIQLPTPIPVHLTYQTAFVDDEGRLVLRSDVYGMDSRMLSAIKTERGMIEVAQERKRERDDSASTGRRQARQQQLPPQTRSVSFFEQLFGGNGGGGGGPSPRPPAPVRIR